MSPSTRYTKMGLIATLGLTASSWAAPHLQVESAVVGAKTVVLTLDEPIQISDLRSIQVEGYDIEQASFIEEQDSLVLNPLVMDLTAKDSPKIRELVPSQKQLVLEAPLFFVPRNGLVLADTAFGGVLCRIISAAPEGTSIGITRRWIIYYEAASVEDVFIAADLRFRSTVDLSIVPDDSTESSDVLGVWPDSTLASGHMEFGWSQARVLFTPELSGQIRLTGGHLIAFDLGLQGVAEATARFNMTLAGAGRFVWERSLPNIKSITIPLGHGLQLTAVHQPVFSVEAEAADAHLVGNVQFRLQQNMKGVFPSQATETPRADARLNYEIMPSSLASGEGTVHFKIRSLLDVKLGASDSHRLTVVHEATLSQGEQDSSWLPHSRLTLQNPWQKQVKLGGSLSLEQGIDSLEPTRAWLLFNHELPLLSPPKSVMAQLIRAEKNKLSLLCTAQPKADWYSVQALMPDGFWTTWVEHAVISRIKLPEFTGPQPLRLRVLAGNSYGVSPPWPQDGLILPLPNKPPFIPSALLPENNTVTDTSLRLSWKGGDADSGARVEYKVFLDTHNPPVSIMASPANDSVLQLTGLHAATTYFWRIRASDGLDTVESPVMSFKTRDTVAQKPLRAAVHSLSGNPWVYLPRGHFVREDDEVITVGPVFMQKYEVSQGEFKKVMGENPSYRDQDSLPVERVTWDEAQNYCTEVGGRLPTEAEWEYAGHGGGSGLPWAKGKASEYAWFNGNADGHTRKVGQLKPNAMGLYDMAGNVFEWVEDWYAPYEPGVTDHPKGPNNGTARVIRGASWFSEEANLNPSARFSNRPGFRNYKVGFRCVHNLPASPATAEKTPLPTTP